MMKHESKRRKPLLIDIMLNGKFFGQVRYTGAVDYEMIDGRMIPAYDDDALSLFVEKERPSLIGKDYRLRITEQRI